jgi:RNA polymerase sigma-70 factor, ECF subfamily
MNDIELNICIKQFKKSGDNVYFEKIYHHFLSKIYRFIYFQVLDNQIAEDLTSEVFIKIYGSIRKSNLNASIFKAWAFKIAHNATIDYFRREKKNKNDVSFEQYVEEYNEHEIKDKNLIKEEKYLANELLLANDKLMDLINRLPAEQKKIVLLRYADELDYKTIGTILNKNESAVRTMSFRALKYIKEEINK